jgi:hypothetical protein
MLNYTQLGFTLEQNVHLQDAEFILERECLWDWLKNADLGDLDAKEMSIIGHHMKIRHTETSFIDTMKVMQQLAKLGVDEFFTMYLGQIIGAEYKAKEVVQRTPEMDQKVLAAYKKLGPFQKAPKWITEYITLYPGIVNPV